MRILSISQAVVAALALCAAPAAAQLPVATNSSASNATAMGDGSAPPVATATATATADSTGAVNATTTANATGDATAAAGANATATAGGEVPPVMPPEMPAAPATNATAPPPMANTTESPPMNPTMPAGGNETVLAPPAENETMPAGGNETVSAPPAGNATMPAGGNETVSAPPAGNETMPAGGNETVSATPPPSNVTSPVPGNSTVPPAPADGNSTTNVTDPRADEIKLGYVPTQLDRLKLAAHTIGINMAYYEAQRAGVRPNDSVALFPNVWEWKQPAYVNACADFLSTLSPEDRAGVDFPNNLGFFEAGNSVLVTGPSAFTATQRAIGALIYMPQLDVMFGQAYLGDPAGCMEGNFTQTRLSQLVMRQVRYEAATLSNSIVKTRANNSDFAMLIGVADSSTYEKAAYPSWLTPPAYQQKCYFADMTHPAADVAAQAAAGLAMTAKVLATYGDETDKQNAQLYATEAGRAFEYAKLMWRAYGENSICSRTVASRNCIGSGCTPLDGTGEPVLSPCLLYINSKPPLQYLYVASAALYYLTGSSYYRFDADFFWPVESPDLLAFLYNWNNVVAQGNIIMSMAPEFPGAARNRDHYRNQLRAGVAQWAKCSNAGSAEHFAERICERTNGGNAYPLSMPWGSLGTAMNGMCMAGVYQALNYDSVESPLRKSAACFVQRQLGYTLNHKCPATNAETFNSTCNTPEPLNGEGFSYMVGFGEHYPTRVHSRDAAYPNWNSTTALDGSKLCGALVSGPYGRTDTDGEWGAIATGTDLYSNDRHLFREAEPAIDFTSSLVCAMMGYASTPDALYADCNTRTAFTGRTVL